jgi:hypothetical protein
MVVMKSREAAAHGPVATERRFGVSRCSIREFPVHIVLDGFLAIG